MGVRSSCFSRQDDHELDLGTRSTAREQPAEKDLACVGASSAAPLLSASAAPVSKAASQDTAHAAIEETALPSPKNPANRAVEQAQAGDQLNSAAQLAAYSAKQGEPQATDEAASSLGGGGKRADEVRADARPPSAPMAHDHLRSQQLPTMMLPEVSLMMTLVDLKAGVVLQNTASVRYYGDRKHSPLSNLLGSLLRNDPDLLANILETLVNGMLWKGTIPVRASLLVRSPDPSASGDVLNSPSTLLARLSRCNTVLCSDTSFASSAPTQAPKLRWLMETIHNNQNSCPVTGMLPGMSSRDFSASQSCIEQGYIKAQSGQFRAPSRRVSSFVNYKSLPIPNLGSNIDLPRDSATEPRASAATTSSAASAQLLSASTMPAPSIAPPAPVAVSRTPSVPPSAPSHPVISLDALRLFFPAWAVRPRFDENSVVAALGNALADGLQLQEAVHGHVSAEHRSTSNAIINLNEMLSLPTMASDGEAEMAFLLGLAQKAEAVHEAGGDAQQTLGGSGSPADAWHEVEAVPMIDPVTHQQMVMLIQRVVTEQVIAERSLTEMTESQLNVLQQMFPRHVLELMLGKGLGSLASAGGSVKSLARSHDSVTIMFLDVVGFTSMSEQVEPTEVMAFLNELFSLFDELVDQYGVYKVETAGDCYIVAGGLMQQEEHGFVSVDSTATCATQGAEKVMAFAKALIRCSRAMSTPHDQQRCRVRVGIHTGPVVSGVIGRKLPKFSIFGDTMNTAARMESTSKPGCIQISAATHALLGSHSFEPTGGVEIKGKGIMETFLWDPAIHPEEHYMHPADQAKEAAAILNHGLDKAAHRSQRSPKSSASSPSLLPASLMHSMAFPTPDGTEPANHLLAKLLTASASTTSQPADSWEFATGSPRLMRTHQ